MLPRRSTAAIALWAVLPVRGRAEGSAAGANGAKNPAPAAGPRPADSTAAKVEPAQPAKQPPAPPKPVVEPVSKEQVVAILGRPVIGPQNSAIGRLIDVLVDGTGQPQAAVIDVGGFMGLGIRTIAVHWNSLHFRPWDQNNPIVLDLTLDQIKAAPEYKGLQKPAPVVVAKPAQSTPAH